ncbi:MAG: class I SAM-dependent RNA methyltransferase [Cytophagaceae bacterium]|nr:class I SAM-dependent RNA methyltransferase [Cytophagaceae bacterium]MBL0304040.1 class I SAM-dependent RNA methyltransferase [Cytophagaceae bacterium]MBL0326852.1 class I SAM-dependent RNA methyltransferase [Cytophagaceae bacterium]
MQKYEMIATTLMGLEKELSNEIEQLGGENIEILKRAVRFFGDDKLMYTANMSLRTALRILIPIDDFKATNEDDLYHSVKSFPWENIFGLHQTFAIDAVTSGEYFKHSKFVALRAKDAIADRFREKTGRRPNVDPIEPDIAINLHINVSEVSVSLDSSGVSLDKRGYRINKTLAPINEVLAAGIILKSGWKSDLPFYDPMSGSGTFSIEAALLGSNTAPGLNRTFSFQNWGEYDSLLFEKIKNELISQKKEDNLKILARDILTQNIEIIAENAMNAGVEDFISLKKADFFQTDPVDNNGILVLNPPYGERLKLGNIFDYYARIGDTFKQKYAGFDAWMISSDKEALKYVGLRGDEKYDMNNGGLEARLVKYRLFKGKGNI